MTKETFRLLTHLGVTGCGIDTDSAPVGIIFDNSRFFVSSSIDYLTPNNGYGTTRVDVIGFQKQKHKLGSCNVYTVEIWHKHCDTEEVATG